MAQIIHGSDLERAFTRGGLILDSSPTVLIIDDNPLSRGDLMGMVQALGFKVLMSPGVQDGLDQCGDRPPWAVISHLELPHLSGLLAAYSLKARFPGTRVLLINHNGSVASEDRLRDMGADFLLHAPVTFSTLRLALWPVIKTGLAD